MTGRPKGGGLEGAANPQQIRWFRQKGESRKAYEAFAVYRDLGIGRSLPKVATHLGKSLELMKRWSARHEWVDRAAAFDANEDFEHMVAMREQRLKQRINDAKLARLIKQKVVDRMNNLDASELTPKQLIQWFEVGVKIERLCLGDSTQASDTMTMHAQEESELMKAVERDPELANDAAQLLARIRQVEGY